ncbi:MAG: SIMPL domain-containing protein [bacterium]|nr:SIMPL domain-containing protein [bacterium]
MDIEKKEIHIVPPARMQTAGMFALAMLGLFLLVLTISSLKQYHYIGSGVAASNTITVSGDGEVFAVPDTATFSVTVQEEAKEVKAAQEVATKKGNDIKSYLKSQGIDEKDIQTTDYSLYPQYDYTNSVCSGGYCPPGKQVLRGFQVSETLTVKVRDTKKAGDILAGVGSKGASSVSGLSFTIDDQDKLDAEARDKAIAKAKEKAEALADALGVSIVRVVGFSEGGGGGPIYYAKTMALGMGGASDAALPPSPEIALGQNKITSNVTVTYEIR